MTIIGYYDLNQFTHTCTQTICIDKGKIPLKFSEILTSNDFPPQVKVKPQGVRDPCSSAQVPSAMVTSEFEVL